MRQRALRLSIAGAITEVAACLAFAAGAVAMPLPPTAAETVRITGTTARVVQGGTARVTARVTPATARCVATLRSPNGAIGGRSTRSVRNGSVSFDWRIGPRAAPGRWTVALSCGLAGTARTSFLVVRRTAPQPLYNTTWTAISTGADILDTPSVALDGGKVVVAYLTIRTSLANRASAEAATFTPSHSRDVEGLRRDQITDGWWSVWDPVLLAHAGGGLQVLLHGINYNLRPHPGALTAFAQRNSDGSFRPPVLAAHDFRMFTGGEAVLAPDGQPLWADNDPLAYLSLWHGATAAREAMLENLLPGSHYAFEASVGRDRSGRYWLAWLAYDGVRLGLWMVQIDPLILAPVGAPQRAPGSETDGPDNLGPLAFACAAACRLVYQEDRGSGEHIVSWAPGEPAATTVIRANAGEDLAAAYTASGRLWIVWTENLRYRAVLGNAAGAGGRPIALGTPREAALHAHYQVEAVSSAAGLVVVTSVHLTGDRATRFVNVVSPP